MPIEPDITTITGQPLYQSIGITPQSLRFNGQPNPEEDSVHVEGNELLIAGDDEIAHRINDPFAFRES
jgi:hypothetical protein